MVWAITVIASLVLVALVGLTAVHVGTNVVALYGQAPAAHTQGPTPTYYLVDKLYRPIGGGAPDAARAEAGRILDVSFANAETLSNEDRDRLIALVARNAGISRSEAAGRVDYMQADIQTKTRRAAGVAQKIASYASLWIAFSLLFGLIVAIFAAISARTEDDREGITQTY